MSQTAADSDESIVIDLRILDRAHSHAATRIGDTWYRKGVDPDSEPTKRVFIDDSGCCGFKFDNSSSRFLVMAGVTFEESSHLALLAERCDFARDELSMHREFKTHSMSAKKLRRLFEYLDDVPFHVRYFIVDKTRLIKPALTDDPSQLKSWATSMLVKHHWGQWTGARLHVDGQDTRGFGFPDGGYFIAKSGVKSEPVHSARFVDSRTSIGIQIADLCAGSMRRIQEGKTVPESVRESIYDRSNQPKGNRFFFPRR